ncbi:hypothetical protein [Nocardia salmonicida]|uniref:hypothetical protein n=1 Tax=Nocardia salmonicida TaxID=53431 RepID=UPI003CEC1A5C
MTDTARAEPPFQLQGSCRDMNGLTGRIVPVMNDEELETLIDDTTTVAKPKPLPRAQKRPFRTGRTPGPTHPRPKPPDGARSNPPTSETWRSEAAKTIPWSARSAVSAYSRIVSTLSKEAAVIDCRPGFPDSMEPIGPLARPRQ